MPRIRPRSILKRTSIRRVPGLKSLREEGRKTLERPIPSRKNRNLRAPARAVEEDTSLAKKGKGIKARSRFPRSRSSGRESDGRARPCPTSLPPCREQRAPPGPRCGSCPLAQSFQDQRRSVEHSQFEIAAARKHMSLAIGFQGSETLGEKTNSAFAATQTTSRKAATVTASIMIDQK